MNLDTRTWPEAEQISKPKRPSEAALTFRYFFVPAIVAVLILSALSYSMFHLRGGMEDLEEVVLSKEVELVARTIDDQIKLNVNQPAPETVNLDSRYVTVDGQLTLLRLEPEHQIQYSTVAGGYRLCLLGRADLWSSYDSLTGQVNTGTGHRSCP